MACLRVRLLGPLQVTLDEVAATGFVSDKVRALLAYLALETGQPHRREKLAGLLWPERSARANLRPALSNLRQVVRDRKATPPLLYVSWQTVQLNPEGDAWPVDHPDLAFSSPFDATSLRPCTQSSSCVCRPVRVRGRLLQGCRRTPSDQIRPDAAVAVTPS